MTLAELQYETRGRTAVATRVQASKKRGFCSLARHLATLEEFRFILRGRAQRDGELACKATLVLREQVSSCARERSSVQDDNTRNGARYARSTH